jgi:hypothetical protein
MRTINPVTTSSMTTLRALANASRASLAAVLRLVGEGGTATEVDPKAYVDALLEVHRKSSETVKRSFKGEAGFVASLDKACRDFVNKNAATGTSSTKSPELLAKHADALLRKNNKMAEEEDLESALNRVVRTFSGYLCGTRPDPLFRWYDGIIQVPRGQGRLPDILHH